MYAFSYVMMIVIIAYVSYRIGRAIWNCFDHSKVDDNTMLSKDATIVNVHSEKTQYVKDGMKYKTTVYFSDGFQFVSHKTDRDDGLFTYRISISPHLYENIIECAKEAHDRALAKQQPNLKPELNMEAKENSFLKMFCILLFAIVYIAAMIAIAFR